MFSVITTEYIITIILVVQYFEEACSWAANEKTALSAVVLVGHWNTPGDGCEGGLSVPVAYERLLTLNACKPIASKVVNSSL